MRLHAKEQHAGNVIAMHVNGHYDNVNIEKFRFLFVNEFSFSISGTVVKHLIYVNKQVTTTAAL